MDQVILPPLLDSYSGSYKFIKVFHIPNGGPSAARKFAIDNCSSDFIAFCDSDDYVDSDWLLTMYKALIDNDSDFSKIMAYVNEDIVDTTPPSPILHIWDRNQSIEKFLEHRLLNGTLWTNLFKRKLFDGLEWRQEMVCFEDGYLMWQILQKVNKVVRIEVRKYHYMMYSTSLSRARYSYRFHCSIRTLFNRIIRDCTENTSLLPFKHDALQLEYYYTSSYLSQSFKSHYPESNMAEQEMITILRKGGLKRLLKLKGVKSKLKTTALVVAPRLIRFLLSHRK